MLNILKLTSVLMLTVIGSLNSDKALGDMISKSDPTFLYGDKLEFSVLRNGAVVGNHLVTFKKRNRDLEVTSKFNLKLSLLGIPIYKYQYDSVGYWSDGMLMSLNVDVNDDGIKKRNVVIREKESFWVNGIKIDGPENSNLFPTNHWNADVLQQGRVLNTITGKVNLTNIQNEGQEVIAIRGGDIEASKYSYSGDLNVTAWYDREGRWVKLKFKGEDNSDIEYFCLTCNTIAGRLDD